MNRSFLHELNSDIGARFTEFGGWEMPLRYGSVLAEHRAVREKAGVFDVSHLGRFRLTGRGAGPALRRLLCNDIERIGPGRCQYTMMLNEAGGIVDDLIVWWWEEDEFWVMPNAANHDRVMGAFAAEPDTAVSDVREDTVFLAVQGPQAPQVLSAVLGTAPGRLRNTRLDWEGGTVSMAGTGYTGEQGGELCVDPATADRLFRRLIAEQVTPCGLGARDTLRLEAGLPLWGEDIDETTTPLEAGLGFAVSMGREFVGREALAAQQHNGLDRRLIGFVLDGRGIPRPDNVIKTTGGGEGQVTSGNLSPMLGTGIGLGYVSPPPAPENETLQVQIRGKWVPGRTANPPFHKNPAQ
ncbi:MAG: glycine cleavage system aminomethyltransferase GcvT [Acidimicrobiia bacterium]